MGTLLGWYLNPHKTQFDGGPKEGQNCSPTSVANGANAVTRGVVNHSGTWFRALLPSWQETDPYTAGWSIPDCIKAAAKVGLSLVNWTGRGWASLRSALDSGHYVILQGDSDQFSNSTCSGVFNGNHAIGIHPARRVVNGSTQHWIDDPICKTGRWEYDYTLIRYANKYASNIRYAVFSRTVPKAATPYVWGPTYKQPPPSTATFAVQYEPGTYFHYNRDGTRHGTFTTPNGFTAYGNSRYPVGSRLFGKMIDGPNPGLNVDTDEANTYWPKP